MQNITDFIRRDPTLVQTLIEIRGHVETQNGVRRVVFLDSHRKSPNQGTFATELVIQQEFWKEKVYKTIISPLYLGEEGTQCTNPLERSGEHLFLSTTSKGTLSSAERASLRNSCVVLQRISEKTFHAYLRVALDTLAFPELDYVLSVDPAYRLRRRRNH